MRTVSRSVPAPAHLGVDVLGVPEGSALELDLRLESVVEGVLVSGTVAATVAGDCVRCLDPVTRDLVVDLQELFVHSGEGRGRHHGSDADDQAEDLPALEGDLLDLEPTVRDAVVLALPLQPVCRDDCPGLCPICGVRLEEDPDGSAHRHEESDPRWAALRQLTD